MGINIIACVDNNMAIGANNKLLAEIKEDMKRFIELTTPKNKSTFVVMGRSTYESVLSYTSGRGLLNRPTIVLTSDPNYKTAKEEDVVYTSLSMLLQGYYEVSPPDTVLNICGGAQVYRHFMKHADNVYLTHVEASFPEADSYLEGFNVKDFRITNHKGFEPTYTNPYHYSFIDFKRKKKWFSL